jgi:hypothetical protein
MFRVIAGLVLLLTVPFVAIACGDDDDNGGTTPVAATSTAVADTTGTSELTQQDENQLSQAVLDYFVVLGDQDQTRLRDMLRDPSDGAITQAMDRQRDRLYQLVQIMSYDVTAPDQVSVKLKVRDKDGTESTKTLEFERDQDQWKLRDPELH